MYACMQQTDCFKNELVLSHYINSCCFQLHVRLQQCDPNNCKDLPQRDLPFLLESAVSTFKDVGVLAVPSVLLVTVAHCAQILSR